MNSVAALMADGAASPLSRNDPVLLSRNDPALMLGAIHIHDEASEAMRGLERARDDAKNAERVARHHLSKLLLRHGRRYPGFSGSFDLIQSGQLEGSTRLG